MMKYISYKNY